MALGLALVFSVMRFINFAAGELTTIGGYSLILFAWLEPWLFAAGAAVIVAGLAAMLMERAAFRPLRGASPDTLMVSSFAISFLLQNVALATIGSRPKGVALPELFSASVRIGGVFVSSVDLMIIITAAVLLIGVTIFLQRSSAGLQMRAAAEDFQMARLLGTNGNRVILMAFALAGLIAGVVSVLLMGKIGVVDPKIGMSPAIVGLIAVVVGGMGTLSGPVIGGMFLGAIATVLQAGLPASVVNFRDAFLYVLVIAVMLLRPQGLLPSKIGVERV